MYVTFAVLATLVGKNKIPIKVVLLHLSNHSMIFKITTLVSCSFF
jgi:hypothetical protein